MILCDRSERGWWGLCFLRERRAISCATEFRPCFWRTRLVSYLTVTSCSIFSSLAVPWYCFENGPWGQPVGCSCWWLGKSNAGRWDLWDPQSNPFSCLDMVRIQTSPGPMVLLDTHSSLGILYLGNLRIWGKKILFILQLAFPHPPPPPFSSSVEKISTMVAPPLWVRLALWE